MRIDASEFPVIWLRDGEDDGTDEARLTEILERGERFVMIAERLPRQEDMGEMDHEEKRRRALLFKNYRATLMRLCAGMFVIQGTAPVSTAIKVFIEGAGKAFGVPFIFVRTSEEAVMQARKRLAQG